MTIDNCITILDTLLHTELQEHYDNSGAQIVFGGMEVRSILIALDIDRSVVEEAIRKKCQLILVHHPVFFHPVTKIDASNPASSLLIDIIDKRISFSS